MAWVARFRPRRHIRPQEDRLKPSGGESTPPQPHFPGSIADIHETIHILKQVSKNRLPDEILKHILFHGDYDCLHFTASSETEVTVRSEQCLDGVRPYTETQALSDIVRPGDDGGRIRSVRIRATSKDQGWVQDRNAGVWSWLGVGRRSDVSLETQLGPKWAQNLLASKEWQDHEFVYDADEPGDGEMDEWVRSLGNGDRVSIVPMAKYGGWECNIQSGSIDVEVEVWR